MNQTPPSFALIQGKRPAEVIEFNDSQMLVAFPATDNVITHCFTNVYLKERKTVTLNVKYDDSLAIYMNGAKIFENKNNGMQAVKVALGFNKGWNTVEILQGEKDGGETLDLGLKLSTQVDKLTAYIGVGDKDDTRLIETETSLKQTKESIKLLAEKAEVTELGNKIKSTQASLEVTNNAIKSKVEQKEFDAYSDKVTKAETSVEQLSESIKTKVEKKEYDSLNNIVTGNSTTIEQLKGSIDLKASKEDFNGVVDRVGKAESTLSVNTEAIKSKVEKTELDKATGRLTTAEGQIKVMSEEISLTVKKKDFDAVNQGVKDSISEIKQNAEGIKQSVTETNSKLDGLQIGSRNYIAKGAEEVVLENNVLGQSKATQKALVSDALQDLRNSEIVLSFYAKTTNLAHGTSGNNSVGIELSLVFEDGTQAWFELCYKKVVNIGSTSGYVRYDSISTNRKFKVADKPIKSGYMNVLLRDATGKIQIKSVQLERGNKLTDFGIAQEDLTGSISEVSEKTSSVEQKADSIKQTVDTVSKTVTDQGTKLTSQQTSIENMGKAINLKAEATNVYSKSEADGKTKTAVDNAKAEIKIKTDEITQSVTSVNKAVDGMKTTIESQGTQIKQTADDIALNVVKNDKVISSINASKEGIKISAPKLDITGAVTFESLDSSMKGKVNAGADAKNQIDGMQFGAKNIVRKKQITPINVASSSYDEATNTWTLTANSGAGGSWGAGVRIIDKTSVVPIGSWFAVSFEIFSPINATWAVDVNNFPVTGTSTSNDNDDTALRKTSDKILKANTWTKCWFTWKNKDNSTSDLYDQSNIGLVNNSGAPVTFKIRNVKGELGNVVTDYSLAQEDIDEAIANITFGGRNIFLNAGLLQGSANWYSNVAGTTIVTDGEDKAFKFTPNTGAGRAGIYQRLGGGTSATKVFEKDQEYTVSVMMKASTGSHKLHIGAESIDVKTVDVDTTWREYTHTFKGTGAGNGTVIFYTTALANGVDFFIKRMQLEKGNRKTDFTLAPEDYDKLISDVDKKAQDTQTAIDNISIGGNNLLLESHADYSTTEYQIATYTLTENWVAGQEYTFVIKGTVPAGQKFGIWMNGGSSNVGYATTKYADGVTYVTFKALAPAGGHTKSLNLYNVPQNTTASTVDWVALYRGNKPMDWTISSGDIQNLFTGVDEKATASKNAIADMSNDNKATPIEKQQLKKEWATITAEKPNYEALANSYGITTEKTNYVNSYNVLNTAIAPIISNTTATSDINGATFRNTFDDYYDKKSQLVKKINELAKKRAEDAETNSKNYTNVISSNESSYINKNYNFADWTGSLPNGYVGVTGTAPTKVASENGNGNTVKFSSLAGQPSYFSIKATNKPFYQYVYVEATFKLESGSVKGAGVLFRHYKTDGKTILYDNYLKLSDEVPSPVLNKWYTASRVIKVNASTDFNGYEIYPMASFSTIEATMPANVLYYDSVITRPATEQEINSYESNIAIKDMSNDNKLTPIEKQQLKKEWAVMVAEKPQYEALASTFGVTTEKTNYVNSYNVLNTLLTPLLANITVTSDINGGTFRNTFDDYYDRKAQLVKKINELSKVLTQGLNGKVLYSDPMFKNGLNDVKVYNNSANSNVTINRVAKPSDAPTNSTHVLEIKSLALPISPSYGGFSFQTASRANAVFVTRIVAKIPVGSSLVFASNSTGTGGKQEWLTPTVGTGKWEEYLFRLECGSTGTFSSTNFFNIYGGTLPLTWHVAYATVIDATDYDYSITDMSNDNKLTPLEKQQLKKEWATISAEKPQYEALSNTFGITTEKTNYINSYNALSTLLTPLIADITATSDVNGQTFRNTFDDYYDKKAQLVRKINELSRSIGTGADAKAQEVKNSIADMSSDSKITPVEKVQLKKEWAVMASEKPQYEVLATTYGIATEKTNFVNAYNTLNTVLNGTGGILTNMTATSAVTGATFRGQFDDYYDKKSQLVKVINEKAKSLADSAQGTANGVNNTIKPWIFPNKTTINGGQIETGSVKAVQIDVTNLFANTAFINNLKSQNVSADKIVGGVIKGIRYESINASNASIKLVLEGNTVKSYGALSGGKQNYAEMKEGGMSVFEMAESGSPFGDKKAFVEPARFNAQQGSRSSAFEPTELRFYVPNMIGKMSFDVVPNGTTGYGLRLEAPEGVLVKNTYGIQYPALQFDSNQAIYFDGLGNIKGCTGAVDGSTWSVKDASERVRLLLPIGKGATGSNDYRSYTGGHKFYHNDNLGISTYTKGSEEALIQFCGGANFKYWKGGNYFECKNQADNGFVQLYASAFNTASSIEWKEDIHNYKESALDAVMGANIVTYKYKSDVEESDNPHTHVGVIAEYAPKAIQSKDGRGIDNYAMTSIAWKAIQELSEQVRYLKEKLNNK
ncbi:tail fiber domain-containing protein [Bacillus mycoides]|uniref:tail fiber domain-containing protein n=1 Tax=Bacillus mycoides TaxID=1405 RepID=UPI003CFFFC90